MAFRIGQKVAYDAKAEVTRKKRGNIDWPGTVTSGTVLTIREIDTRYLRSYGVVGLRFNELSFPPKLCAWGPVEPAFPADRFRPIIERKTEIGMAILREILDRESHEDSVPAK